MRRSNRSVELARHHDAPSATQSVLRSRCLPSLCALEPLSAFPSSLPMTAAFALTLARQGGCDGWPRCPGQRQPGAEAQLATFSSRRLCFLQLSLPLSLSRQKRSTCFDNENSFCTFDFMRGRVRKLEDGKRNKEGGEGEVGAGELGRAKGMMRRGRGGRRGEERQGEGDLLLLCYDFAARATRGGRGQSEESERRGSAGGRGRGRTGRGVRRRREADADMVERGA